MASSIRSATETAMALLIAAILALGPTAARADAGEEAKARQLYKSGMKAYDVGDFDGALKLYSDAYKLASLPGFLFNIAQCHRQLANYERAAFFYGRFIDTSKPKAMNVDLATQLLAEMKTKQSEKAAAEKAKAEDDARKEDVRREELKKLDAPLVSNLVVPGSELPPPPPPPLLEETPTYKKWWFWTLVSVAVAAAAGGATVAVIASNQPQPNPTTLLPIGNH
jgi:tetratricopeptide (TPR) repeat protein